MRYLLFIVLVVFATTIAVSADAQMHEDQIAVDSSMTDIDLVIEGESLRREQAKLQEEFENIMRARNEVEDLPPLDASDEEFDAYVQKVKEINKRIKNYEKNLEDLDNRIEAYNALFIE